MKVLHLTLKKKWFDMVGNGKSEEYRDLTMFWARRFAYRIKSPHGGYYSDINGILLGEDGKYWDNFTGGCQRFNSYDQVLFANGGHFGNVPKKLFEFNGIEIREGRPEWGAEPGKKYFVIKLGKQL